MKIHDIDETFDTDPDQLVNDVDSSSYVSYNVKTGDDHMTVELARQPNTNEWELVFKRNGTMGISGEGNATKIFSSIISVIKQFIDTHKVDELTFLSQKLEIAYGGDSRTRLYKAMVSRFARQYGFSYYTIPTDDDELFVIKVN